MFWFFVYEAWGILAPWPGVELRQTCSLSIGRWSLNHKTAREVPISSLLPARNGVFVCLSLFFDVQMLTVFKQKQFDILVVVAQSFSLYVGFEN